MYSFIFEKEVYKGRDLDNKVITKINSKVLYEKTVIGMMECYYISREALGRDYETEYLNTLDSRERDWIIENQLNFEYWEEYQDFLEEKYMSLDELYEGVFYQWLGPENALKLEEIDLYGLVDNRSVLILTKVEIKKKVKLSTVIESFVNTINFMFNVKNVFIVNLLDKNVINDCSERMNILNDNGFIVLSSKLELCKNEEDKLSLIGGIL